MEVLPACPGALAGFRGGRPRAKPCGEPGCGFPGNIIVAGTLAGGGLHLRDNPWMRPRSKGCGGSAWVAGGGNARD